jgi:hypothetical protein
MRFKMKYLVIDVNEAIYSEVQSLIPGAALGSAEFDAAGWTVVVSMEDSSGAIALAQRCLELMPCVRFVCLYPSESLWWRLRAQFGQEPQCSVVNREGTVMSLPESAILPPFMAPDGSANVVVIGGSPARQRAAVDAGAIVFEGDQWRAGGYEALLSND